MIPVKWHLQEISEKSSINDTSDLSASSASESAITDNEESAVDSIDTSVDTSLSENKQLRTQLCFHRFSSLNETENPDEVNISKSKYFKANPQTVSTLSLTKLVLGINLTVLMRSFLGGLEG